MHTVTKKACLLQNEKNFSHGKQKKVIYPQWNVLRNVEKLSICSCIYYIICWAFISYFKYRK